MMMLIKKMKQITIQKQYLILVEMSENIYRLFLVIVNFIIEIKNTVEEVVSSAFVKVARYIKAIFGFNIYKLNTQEIDSKNLYLKDFLFNKNLNQERFLRYSNLLAPPYK